MDTFFIRLWRQRKSFSELKWQVLAPEPNNSSNKGSFQSYFAAYSFSSTCYSYAVKSHRYSQFPEPSHRDPCRSRQLIAKRRLRLPKPYSKSRRCHSRFHIPPSKSKLNKKTLSELEEEQSQLNPLLLARRGQRERDPGCL